MERTARCTCGQLRALCRGEPVRVAVCSCLAFKQRTGSAFSTNATFDAGQVETTGRSVSYTRRADTGRWATFAFCPICGSTVSYAIEARPGRVSIPVGAFADPGFPEPTIACRKDRRETWVAFAPEGGMTEE